ncbi:low temperature requirement protein A [Micromonospora sp. NBC_01699]|uniref:low temperature requirement protein A n=1 Tax=Micromonospora sp. NBC_01699 TaxID=2975984 RepID=UPI002E2CED0A|nr:low temperature requirement protein A [Micromonospora sp. NBC_01699]
MRAIGDRWWRWRFTPLSEGTKVTRLELFFDLVFVYAFFNMARSTSEDFNLDGLLRGLLVLSLLWWCWCSYVMTGNSVRTDAGIMPVVLFAAMAIIFVASLTIPQSFTERPGTLSAPLVFAVCYFLVRALHLSVFWYVAHNNPLLRHQLVRITVPTLVATLLLVAAALVPQHLVDQPHRFDTRVALWSLAVIIEYGASVAVGFKGFDIPSAAHCAERYALITTIAFGEAIISVGTGAREVGPSVTWPLIGAAVLGIVLTACLWWAYFDLIALAAEQVLRELHGAARVALARDAYNYLHLPMIAGIITLSLGAEKLLRAAGNPVTMHQPLRGLALYLLYGGTILFLLGHLAFQLRALRTVSWTRVITIVGLAALVPLAGRMPGLGALGLLTAVCLALTITELVIFADSRRALRTAVHQEALSHAARETEWRRRHR